MTLITEHYHKQLNRWPKDGKHILCQYDDTSVIVYQAYRPSIGKFAIEHQYFGGDFSYSRMSWIKTNFLWMMYRSGWGQKPGQEITLGIRLTREFFDQLLVTAVASSNTENLPKAEWDARMASSYVRLQWDPDHHPTGAKEERRAIQLGLKHDFLEPFKGDAIVEIIDMTEFVEEQRHIVDRGEFDQLITPKETVYPVSLEAANNLGMHQV